MQSYCTETVDRIASAKITKEGAAGSREDLLSLSRGFSTGNRATGGGLREGAGPALVTSVEETSGHRRRTERTTSTTWRSTARLESFLRSFLSRNVRGWLLARGR